MLGRDELPLHGSFRKDQHLRRLRDMQFVEERGQVSKFVVEFQPEFAFLNSLLDRRDWVRRLRLGIENRLVVKRDHVR